MSESCLAHDLAQQPLLDGLARVHGNRRESPVWMPQIVMAAFVADGLESVPLEYFHYLLGGQRRKGGHLTV